MFVWNSKNNKILSFLAYRMGVTALLRLTALLQMFVENTWNSPVILLTGLVLYNSNYCVYANVIGIKYRWTYKTTLYTYLYCSPLVSWLLIWISHGLLFNMHGYKPLYGSLFIPTQLQFYETHFIQLLLYLKSALALGVPGGILQKNSMLTFSKPQESILPVRRVILIHKRVSIKDQSII